MPFDFDSTYLVYLLAAASAVLFVESAYLLGFSTASYRSRINRRLRLLKDQPDRESVLVQLRRERGLTAGGLYGLPILPLNRLVLQSGLTIGLGRLLTTAGVAALFAFGAVTWVRDDIFQAAAAALICAALLPYVGLHFLRRRRHRKFGEQF